MINQFEISTMVSLTKRVEIVYLTGSGVVPPFYYGFVPAKLNSYSKQFSYNRSLIYLDLCLAKGTRLTVTNRKLLDIYQIDVSQLNLTHGDSVISHIDLHTSTLAIVPPLILLAEQSNA